MGIYNGAISFGDGRHRILAAEELGIPEVAVEIPRNQEHLFDYMKVKPELNESPDYIWIDDNIDKDVMRYEEESKKLYLEYDAKDAIPFISKLNGSDIEVYIGKVSTTHRYNWGSNYKDDTLYSGRLWLDHKIISFWTYPDKEIFVDIINQLEEKLKFAAINDKVYQMDGKFWNNNWLVDIIEIDNEFLTDTHYNDILRMHFKDKKKIKYLKIPIENYLKSEDQPDELRKIHLMSSEEKDMLKKAGKDPLKYYKSLGKKKSLAYKQAIYQEKMNESLNYTFQSKKGNGYQVGYQVTYSGKNGNLRIDFCPTEGYWMDDSYTGKYEVFDILKNITEYMENNIDLTKINNIIIVAADNKRERIFTEYLKRFLSKRNLNIKINESPDYINKYDLSYENDYAIPFIGHLQGNDIIVVIGENGETHDSVSTLDRKSFKWSDDDYSGRLWLNKKIISFWNYPNREVFVKIIDKLEEILGQKIWNKKWTIETVLFGKDTPIDRQVPDWRRINDTSDVQIIPIENYMKSEDVPEEERQLHLMSSAEKNLLRKAGKDPLKYYKSLGKEKPLAYKQAIYQESIITKFQDFENNI